MTRTDGKRLTKAQRSALARALKHGTPWANMSVRYQAGGAYRWMLERLADRGFLTRAPYKITDSGRLALTEGKNDD